MTDSNQIIWEKWYSPFGEDDDISIDEEIRSILEEMRPEFFNDTGDEEPEEDLGMKDIAKHIYEQKFMVTPLGVLPITENTDSTKIFNFWTGHTNFNISKEVALAIESCDGVESLDIFTRYRFRISIGKIFKESDVMSNINQKIYDML